MVVVFMVTSLVLTPTRLPRERRRGQLTTNAKKLPFQGKSNAPTPCFGRDHPKLTDEELDQFFGGELRELSASPEIQSSFNRPLVSRCVIRKRCDVQHLNRGAPVGRRFPKLNKPVSQMSGCSEVIAFRNVSDERSKILLT